MNVTGSKAVTIKSLNELNKFVNSEETKRKVQLLNFYRN